MSRIVNFFRTPLYKNTGSTARDHLASERTFLAWIRTGLGFIALGIAVERFSQLDLPALARELKTANSPSQSLPSPPNNSRKRESDERLLVGTLLGTGMGSIVYGSTRYFSNLRILEQGGFKPAFNGPAVLGVVVAGMASASFFSMVNRTKEKESSK
ncbi:uncharacterized protein PV09_06256 [Verruconis gallopava]|uniref:DUF202 domain-containing protein n=1 Tax=Verruconis gallopava TaxID=253628 RepID=A0A0D2ATH7_9PEZI|nr:uncharacterized protein PV09_06256 [Verruconis gallopava]KIW02444.1 hypothetical protein PV09_06256 [Verruconis gallopava]